MKARQPKLAAVPKHRLKSSMNDDIKEFDIFRLTKSGRLIKIDWIKSTDDYNHYLAHLHHYIPKHDFNKNRHWYEERGIKQKLILVSIILHEHIHNIGIKTLSDEEFEQKYKISRWELIFNRKHSKY